MEVGPSYLTDKSDLSDLLKNNKRRTRSGLAV